MSEKVYLALGSNVGDRERNLHAAMERISQTSSVVFRRASGIYETEPVGYTEQGRFLNMVISVETDLEPLELLKNTQEIEHSLKRTREIHWGPRIIDIDILMYGNQRINLPELVIPHPEMHKRAFVLIPLRDVFSEGLVFGEELEVLIGKCGDRYGVQTYKCVNIGKEIDS